MAKVPPKPAAWEEMPDRQTKPKRGIMINIDGAEGTGKTSLALTLAKIGMIAYIDTDQSIDRAQRPAMPKGKKFQAKLIPIRYRAGINPETIKATCLPAWKQAKNASHEAAKDWAKGGVIADSATELWEILRLGVFGTLTPQGRTDRLYGPLNSEFRQWLRTVNRVYMKHLVCINQMKDQYKEGKTKGESVKTGELERVGFKELGYLADMTLRTFKEDGVFKVRIEMCKLAPNGPALEGTELEDDDVDLVKILAMVTGTEEEEWLK